MGRLYVKLFASSVTGQPNHRQRLPSGLKYGDEIEVITELSRASPEGNIEKKVFAKYRTDLRGMNAFWVQ